jgi:putative SbcD/Mre11-related phosphoesterase
MEVTYRDRAVLLAETLVLADLHLGRARAANVQFPAGDDDVLARVEALLERYGPDRVVLAGDVVHAFDHVPPGVAERLATLHDLVVEAGASAIVTLGNHDAQVPSVWPGETADSVRVDDAVVCHGHERPGEDGAGYVFGHDHPTVVIEGVRRPCYLRGRVDGHDLLILPPFNRLVAGTPINGTTAGDFQSPLVTDVNPLRPVVRDESADETRRFPPLNELREFL